MTVGLGDEFNSSDFSAVISEFLSQFMTPEVAGFLATPISKAMQDVTNNRISLPGGLDVPLGPGGMFSGQVAIEHQTANALIQNQISQGLTNSADIAANLRLDMRQGLSQGLFGTEASTGLSGLNLASDMFLYSSLGLEDLQNNMQNAGRYMGVGSPMLNANAQRANNNFSTLAGLITADVGRNPADFSALTGGEVGTLVSEMARTGNFNNLNTGVVSGSDLTNLVQGNDTNLTADIQQQLQGVRDKVRGASEIVAEFQRVFRTDVAGALDQMNSLFGVDVVSTFSPERLKQISNQIPAAGLASGFTSGQVVGLGAAATQQARAAGFEDFTGGMSAGIQSAQLFRAAANDQLVSFNAITGETGVSDSNFAFVNENRFRNNLVKRVTGAQLSGLSRDISGAAAIIESRGGNVEEFLAAVRAQEGTFESDDVLSIANAQLAGDDLGTIGSATALRDASFSQEGRRFLEQGVGTSAVLRNNASFLRQVRSQTVERTLELRGVGKTERDAIMAKMGEGQFTSRAIRAALGKDRSAIANELDRTFSDNARAFGFGTIEEEDLFLNTILRNEKLAEIQERTGNLADVQGMVGDATDSISGFRALAKMVQDDKLSDATLGETIGVFTGSEGVSKEIISQMMGGAGPAENKLKGREGAIRNLAMGTATSVLFAGKFGNKQASDAQVLLSKRIFSKYKLDDQGEVMYDDAGAIELTEEERLEYVGQMEGMVTEDSALAAQMFDVNVADRISEFRRKEGMKEGEAVSKSQAKSLRQAEFLEQFAGVKDIGTIGGDDEAAEEKAFKQKVAALQKDFELAAESGEDLDLTKDQKKTLEKAQREATLNEDLAGVKKGGTETIVAVLQEIMLEIRAARKGDDTP